jgi:hypothetical protein
MAYVQKPNSRIYNKLVKEEVQDVLQIIQVTLFKLYDLIFFNWYNGGGVRLGPLGTAATNWASVRAPGEYNDGEIGGMIGRGNRSTRRKPATVPLCPPQTPHAAQTRTRAAAVGSQSLTA